jgi:hypothetical protein
MKHTFCLPRCRGNSCQDQASDMEANQPRREERQDEGVLLPRADKDGRSRAQLLIKHGRFDSVVLMLHPPLLQGKRRMSRCARVSYRYRLFPRDSGHRLTSTLNRQPSNVHSRSCILNHRHHNPPPLQIMHPQP